ncbi:MAG: 7-carboxy-7-deazaguanine synthase QueE [Candidatus Goldiibacteriota bacterium HGW-Goldbacteria-1]|jgi:7-carboxy-7-deazaguanine synthase|nr:MAG: 7-carboxy-7-deazaguanine synthase QueE [Candidatus Goldiibacteriota bacterium HGW-Goldbacteria-1]
MKKEKQLFVCELFEDLEGEGRFQGYPTFFIRLSECNLRCNWCDTKESYAKGKPYGITKLAKMASESDCCNISITGGEPLLQKSGVKVLIKALRKKCPGKKITVETNGSISVAGLNADNVSMDIKLLSSGVSEKMMLSNLKVLKPKDQVKLVAGSLADLRYAQAVLKKHRTKAEIIVQPVFGRIKFSAIREFILRRGLKWRAMVQLHKMK